MSNKYLAKDGSPHPDTVEQAAEESANKASGMSGDGLTVYEKAEYIIGFKEGVKWQQEQSDGEKDKELKDLKAYADYVKRILDKGEIPMSYDAYK